MRQEITALVLTFDEKENIARTLGAIAWVPEVLLVDSFSTDDTVTLARAAHPNVRVVQRCFDTHTAQWNFGLDQVQTPWVLSLDADYELSPALSEEITRLCPPPDVAGYSVGFRFRVWGRSLRATAYPPRTVLFRPDRARYHDDGHTQLLRADGPVRPLAGVIFHDDRKLLSRWLRSQDRYCLIEARHLLAAAPAGLSPQDRLRRRVYFAPMIMFFYLLLGRGLILDGWPGWYYVLQRTLAEALLSLRLLTEREGLEGASRSEPEKFG